MKEGFFASLYPLPDLIQINSIQQREIVNNADDKFRVNVFRMFA